MCGSGKAVRACPNNNNIDRFVHVMARLLLFNGFKIGRNEIPRAGVAAGEAGVAHTSFHNEKKAVPGL